MSKHECRRCRRADQYEDHVIAPGSPGSPCRWHPARITSSPPPPFRLITLRRIADAPRLRHGQRIPLIDIVPHPPNKRIPPRPPVSTSSPSPPIKGVGTTVSIQPVLPREAIQRILARPTLQHIIILWPVSLSALRTCPRHRRVIPIAGHHPNADQVFSPPSPKTVSIAPAACTKSSPINRPRHDRCCSR